MSDIQILTHFTIIACGSATEPGESVSGSAVQVSLDDKPDGRTEDQPKYKKQPAVHFSHRQALVQAGIEIKGKDLPEGDEQQDSPERRTGGLIFLKVCHFRSGLVEPIKRVDSQSDDHQEDLAPQVTVFDTS